MSHRLLGALLPIALLGGGVCCFAASPGTPCVNLKALTIPNVEIISAAPLAAGGFTAPGSRSPTTLPAFCRVEGIARPTNDSQIRFEVWIPAAESWNGKFQGVGN